MGLAHLPEVRNATTLADDLLGQQGDEDNAPAVAACFPDATAAELASAAGESYLNLARQDSRHATAAESQAMQAVTLRPAGFERPRVLDQIRLAQARFVGGQPEQASQDGFHAIEMAEHVTASTRVSSRLRELVTDSEPYRELAAVRELRERLGVAVPGLN